MDNIRKRCQCPNECKFTPTVVWWRLSQSFADGVAVIDDKYSIINLTDEISTSSCSNLFIDRATYILLAVDSKHAC